MTTHNMKQSLKRQLGYTIDQTILIVAVIAILVTMIIGSVGWDLLTRAGGTKMQSHLVQFENAAGSFFSQFGLWPTDVTDSANEAMRALMGDDTISFVNIGGKAFNPGNNYRNYLSAYNTDGDGDVNHSFGNGGVVELYDTGDTTIPLPKGCPTDMGSGPQDFLVFVLKTVPKSEFVKAKEGIDGSKNANNWTSGRLQSGADAEERTVTLCYLANAVG